MVDRLGFRGDGHGVQSGAVPEGHVVYGAEEQCRPAVIAWRWLDGFEC